MAKDDLFGKIGDFLNKSTQSIKDRLTMDVTDLIRGINKNDLEEVERALNAGVDPNAMDGANRMALPLAIDNNNAKVVKMLLDAGAKVGLLDANGESPLFKAVSWENEPIVRLLLNAGADMQQANRDGRTPLEEARNKGYDQIAQLMVSTHQEVRNKQVKEDRAKHEALKEKARKIQKERAEEEQKRQEKEAAKEAKALQKAKARTAKAVKRKYKVVDDTGWYNALIYAIRDQDQQAIEVFVEEAKAKDTISDLQKGELLLEAIRNENSDLVHQILEWGIDPLALVEGEDHSPLSLAVSKNAYKLVNHLLGINKEKATAMLNDDQQVISLQFVAYKDPKMLDILMDAGANPFFGGKEMPAPLVRAIEKASIGILPVLAKHQIDLNKPVEGRTPLEWAIHFNKSDWVIGLISEGVDTLAKNKEGQNPLELAESLGGRDLIVEALRNS